MFDDNYFDNLIFSIKAKFEKGAHSYVKIGFTVDIDPCL